LFFIGFFAVASAVALVNPFWGVAAYVTHYHSAPERTWWGASLASLGVRYSVTITSFLVAGTLFNLGRLPYGRFLSRQEILYLAFLAWILIGRLINGQETEEDVVDKMFKVAIFVMALTHVIVTPRTFDRFLWVLVLCSLYLGFECYTAPRSYYVNGRLEGVGGPDFSDSNALAGHMVSLLPIIGVRFLRSGWKGKLICFVAGGFIANGVVQTRSRGGYLACLATAVVMMSLAPKGHRKRIMAMLVLGAMGALTLVDSAYVERMLTLRAGEREKDESAMSRLRIWEGGVKMAVDHPLGVGPGNFYTHISKYLPGDAGRDTHNTYVRCVAELGWPGLLLLGLVIANAFKVLARVRRLAATHPDAVECQWNAFGLQMSLSAYLTSSFFISATYIEMLWWLLLLPVALERSTGNAIAGKLS
jgi:O-antigen ligase